MMPPMGDFLSPNDGPHGPPIIKWDVTVDNTPQKLFVEYFGEECIRIRKQDVKLGVGLTSVELLGAIAVLDWIIKAGVVLGEAEHARDILKDAALSVEGK